MELWTSKQVKNDTAGCGNIFHYRPAHSENFYIFCLFWTKFGPWPISALVHMGHGPYGRSPGAPKAIEAIHAEITFATLERNANFKKKKHQFYYVFLRVRAPGDAIYSNLEGGLLRGIRRSPLGPYTKPPGPLQPKAVWGIIRLAKWVDSGNW